MTGALLSIDMWHTHMTAAIRNPDGRITPLVIDGTVQTPTGVAIAVDGTMRTGRTGARLGQQTPASYIRLPGRALLDDHLTVHGRQVNPVDVMAAVLAPVAAAARDCLGTTPEGVVISIPAGWTAGQRQGLRAAAVLAGLGGSHFVRGAEAIVQNELAHGLDLPVGNVAVVCRLTDSAGELVMLQRGPRLYSTLACYDLGEVGQNPGNTVVDQAVRALATGIDATPDIDTDQIAAVLCEGLDVHVRALAAALPTTAGVKVTPTQVGELSAALGSVRMRHPGQTLDMAARPGREMTGAAITMVVAWAVAAALAIQLLNSGTVIDATSISPKFLLTQWYAWALAPVFAMLGTTCLALLTAEHRATQSRREGSGRDPALGASLLLTAALGVGLATGLAIAGSATYDVRPAPLLRWTLGAAVPLAVVIAVLGLIVARLPAPADSLGQAAWRHRLRPPLTAVLVGGLALIALVAVDGGMPRTGPGLAWNLDHLAGYGLGWAIALHLTSDVWRRATVGFLLSAGATYVINTTTSTTIATCLIAAIILWWFQRLMPAPGLVLRAWRRLAADDG